MATSGKPSKPGVAARKPSKSKPRTKMYEDDPRLLPRPKRYTGGTGRAGAARQKLLPRKDPWLWRDSEPGPSPMMPDGISHGRANKAPGRSRPKPPSRNPRT